jgi:ankyrin repeat protein
MAAALNRLFDEDLARASANINAQNSAGTTALMILAAKSSPDEI